MHISLREMVLRQVLFYDISYVLTLHPQENLWHYLIYFCFIFCHWATSLNPLLRLIFHDGETISVLFIWPCVSALPLYGVKKKKKKPQIFFSECTARTCKLKSVGVLSVFCKPDEVLQSCSECCQQRKKECSTNQCLFFHHAIS